MSILVPELGGRSSSPATALGCTDMSGDGGHRGIRPAPARRGAREPLVSAWPVSSTDARVWAKARHSIMSTTPAYLCAGTHALGALGGQVAREALSTRLGHPSALSVTYWVKVAFSTVRGGFGFKDSR